MHHLQEPASIQIPIFYLYFQSGLSGNSSTCSETSIVDISSTRVVAFHTDDYVLYTTSYQYVDC